MTSFDAETDLKPLLLLLLIDYKQYNYCCFSCSINQLMQSRSKYTQSQLRSIQWWMRYTIHCTQTCCPLERTHEPLEFRGFSIESSTMQRQRSRLVNAGATTITTTGTNFGWQNNFYRPRGRGGLCKGKEEKERREASSCQLGLNKVKLHKLCLNYEYLNEWM